MIEPWSVASIRVRLTGWYAAVLALMLVLYATATFLAVRHEFLEQFDDQLHDDFETAEGLLTRTPDGQITWATERHVDPDTDDVRVYDVWSVNGDRLYRSDASIALPPASAAAGTNGIYQSIELSGAHWRTFTGATTVAGRAVTLRVARLQERLRMQLSEVLVVLVLGLPLVVALSGVGGYILARRALAPIDDLGADARRITADRLHDRLSVPNQRDEIGRL